MNKAIVRALSVICLLILGYFALSLASGIVQLSAFAESALAGSGRVVFWGLTGVFGVLLAAPLWIYFRLPKPLVPPAEDSPEALAAYRHALWQRVRKNPRLAPMAAAVDEEFSEERLGMALAQLGDEARRQIKATASAVFVSTAVMQNGRLDGLIVLATQLRLMWRIAQIYHLRPSPRQMLYLYSHVGSNVLIAASLHDIDFAELTTPIMVSILPSMKGGIPGLQGISTLLVNSMANGAANAFLTLRVGLLATSYCEALSRPEAGAVRRSATAAALTLVADIVKEQGAIIVKKSWGTVTAAVVGATEASFTGMKTAAETVAGKTVTGAKSVGGRLSRWWRPEKAG